MSEVMHASKEEERTVAHSKAAEHRVAPKKGGKEQNHAPKRGKKGVLNLGELITPQKVATALKAIADEPGESGELKFELSGVGNIPIAGPLSARLQFLGELSLEYSVNDQNFAVIALDASIAAKAGFDLGGFAHVEAGGGYGRDFLNQWFKTSEDAANWLVHQLASINKTLGGHVLKVEEGKEKGNEEEGHHLHHGLPDRHHHEEEEEPEGEYEVEDRKTFGEVSGGLKAGKLAEGEFKYRKTTLHRKYLHKDKSGKVTETPSTEEHKEWEGTVKVKLPKGIELTVDVHRDWSNTVGSPFYYSNGVFDEYIVTIHLGKDDLLHLGKGEPHQHVPPNAVQDLIVNVFSKLEGIFHKLKFNKAVMVNQKVFDKVVKALYKEWGAELDLGTGFNLILDWNLYGEADGTENLMYFRTSIQPTREVKGEVNTHAVNVESSMEMSKSEVVYEKLGTNTISYIQRQFVYETKDRPWEKFKQEHWEEIKQLVQNCATPGFTYYYPEVEKAFKSGGGHNYKAGVKALEQVWSREKKKLDQIAPDAAKIGEALEKAESFTTKIFAPHRKYDYMGEIVDILLKYAGHPKMLRFLLTQLPNYAVEEQKLWELAKETNYTNLLRRFYETAHLPVKEY